MKTIALTFFLVFTSLSYSFSQYRYRHYKDDFSKRVEFFKQIADSLESSYHFKKYPIESDSFGYMKGFLLCVNKVEKTDKISIIAHHFIGVEEAHRYSAVLKTETFHTYMDPIVIRRDSVCYFLFGYDSEFFGLTGSDYLWDIVSEGHDMHVELDILYARDYKEDEEYYISKYAAEGISIEKYYNPAFIKFMLMPIYKKNRKRGKVVDWSIQRDFTGIIYKKQTFVEFY